MASKRMFAARILCDDDFRLMSAEAQALYVAFCMEADDWGIVGSPVSVRRACGVPEERVAELIDRGFAYEIDRRVVIRHWFLHNTISEDRRAATNFPQVLARLQADAEGVYCLADDIERVAEEPETTAEPHNQAPQQSAGISVEILGNSSNPRGNSGEFQQSPEIPGETLGNSGDTQKSPENPQKSPAIGIGIVLDTTTTPPIIPPYGDDAPPPAAGERDWIAIAPRERDRLNAVMGKEAVDLYIARLTEYCAQKGKTYSNPGATIERWWREDQRKQAQPPKRSAKPKRPSSFDTDEMFADAVRASYGRASP